MDINTYVKTDPYSGLMKSNYELLSIGSFSLKMVKTNINYRLTGPSRAGYQSLRASLKSLV